MSNLERKLTEVISTAVDRGETAGANVLVLRDGSPVAWAAARHVTEGVSRTSFAPDRPCTRAQIVTFLYRACGSPEADDVPAHFSDVPAAAYYAPAVAWAQENGITNGVDRTHFSPAAPCTRAQIVTFLYRTLTRNP